VSPSRSEQQRVLICGGGVIGTTIAYYLGLRDVEATVVERTSVGNASSGKSGGFLAYDWCRGTVVDAMAKRSFGLHAELAEKLRDELGLDWGYRRLDTLSVAASERRDFSSLANLPSPDWIASRAAVHSQIGSESTTAQIHPEEFTRAMMKSAESRGAQLVPGVVDGLLLSDDGRRVNGVIIDGEPVEADAVVVAMGPWSILACQWLPLPAVYGLKGHSLVFRFEPSEPRALFVELETESGNVETPEIVPRPDGTTYVCGITEEPPLPVDPAHVSVDPDHSERLRSMTERVCPELGRADILAEQACYRPVTIDGTPLIGKVPGVDGAYVATGHSVWGMLNAPATGEAMAELIVDGEATSTDLTPFDPSRLSPIDPTELS